MAFFFSLSAMAMYGFMAAREECPVHWTKIGEGGNGATYVNDAEPGVLLKVSYLELAQADDLVQEFNVSKAIDELGVSTPRMLAKKMIKE